MHLHDGLDPMSESFLVLGTSRTQSDKIDEEVCEFLRYNEFAYQRSKKSIFKYSLRH